ncbi:MAG: porin family protein [Bacteroidota bacterium]|nr:porin family protein [Bacteroidota bacterium]
MKNIILIMAIFISIGNRSFAQDNSIDSREKLLFGIKGGVNYSNVYDSQGEEFQADPKLGLVGGAFLAIPIGRYFGLQPEALISQKGFRATGRILGGTYSFTRTTTYLDVPLLFSIKPVEFITLQVGPQYSYLIKQNDVFTNASTSIEQEQEFVNDNIRKNTLCFTGGADINIKHIVLGARAGWDILNNNGDGTSTTPRYKNVWYQATIGYRFYSN